MLLGSNFSRTALKRARCYKSRSVTNAMQTSPGLTSGSMFFFPYWNISRVFLVQCGRQGNSSIRTLASLGSEQFASQFKQDQHDQNFRPSTETSPALGGGTLGAYRNPD